MQNERPKRIEIVDVKLDVNLDEEIKKQAAVDSTTKAKIANIIDKAKLRTPPRQVDPQEAIWNAKFETFFIKLQAEALGVTKDDAAKILEIIVEQLGSAIARFKKFLRETKSGEWVILMDKNEKRERIYILKRFSA